MVQQAAFGVDFGTTNTRVAYYDGRKLQMIPIFDERGGSSYGLPTAVAYEDGRPVAFGQAALDGRRGALPPQSIKWLLDRDGPVEVGGRALDPVTMAADFFGHLRALVAKAVPSTPMDRVAMTIPVHFPPRARDNLRQACALAGVQVAHFYFEPVAALYCNLVARKTSGVAAVFDWGGGSLDIATLKLEDGVAWTRRVEGWHRGGEHFDELICLQAIEALLRARDELPFTAEEILATPKGRQLRRRAELLKILKLSRGSSDVLRYSGLIGNIDVDFPLTAEAFEEWIDQTVAEAVGRLKRALHDTGITPGLLARLFLSGGTCNIPAVQKRLGAQIAGDRLVTAIAIPPTLRADSGGLDDIGNATALGAALLAIYGTRPVFATDVGVRLAHAWDDHDAFYPIFRAGERVTYEPRRERFFVSDARSEVARLLVCDRPDSHALPQGRLLRVIPVPIHRDESWLHVEFTVDPHLVLRVSASGRVARAQPDGPVWIPDLNLGFEVPEVAVAKEVQR